MSRRKSKKVKRIISYICAPIIMAVLGYGLIYMVLHPVFNLASNMLGMVFADSAPDFDSGLSDIYDENADRPVSGTVDSSDIQFPGYGTSYAHLISEDLGMDVKIYWGDSDEIFREGAGQYIGSFLPGYGSVILLGAHDSMYFEPLQDVEKGDIFIIRTNYGEFRYKVSGTMIGSDDDDEVFNNISDKEQLVLYTCYPFGALIGVKDERFYVFADKISGPEVVNGEGE